MPIIRNIHLKFSSRHFARLLVCGFLLLNLSNRGGAQTRDTLWVDTGDRIVGEVKSLSRGLLTYKTVATGTISIRWEHVTALRSPFTYRVEQIDGYFVFGQLFPDTASSVLRVVLDTFSMPIRMENVVTLQPIESSFWDRIDIYLGAGVDYTKASEIVKLNLGATVKQKRYRDLLTFDAQMNSTLSKDKSPSQRIDVRFENSSYLGNLWFLNSNLTYQKNTELGLVSRFGLGGSGGYYFGYSNKQLFAANLGLNGTRELGSDSTGSARPYSLEVTAGLNYSLFEYDQPEMSIDTYVIVYRTITGAGRTRVDYSLQIRWEIINDFFLKNSLYTNFDSDPSSTGASESDYGIVLSLELKI